MHIYLEIQDEQSVEMEIIFEDTMSDQLPCPSPPNTSAVGSSIVKESFSRGAKNKQILESFEKFGKSFDKAMMEDKKCSEQMLQIENEKLKIFKEMKECTERLTSSILNFLNKVDVLNNSK